MKLINFILIVSTALTVSIASESVRIPMTCSELIDAISLGSRGNSQKTLSDASEYIERLRNAFKEVGNGVRSPEQRLLDEVEIRRIVFFTPLYKSNTIHQAVAQTFISFNKLSYEDFRNDLLLFKTKDDTEVRELVDSIVKNIYLSGKFVYDNYNSLEMIEDAKLIGMNLDEYINFTRLWKEDSKESFDSLKYVLIANLFKPDTIFLNGVEAEYKKNINSNKIGPKKFFRSVKKIFSRSKTENENIFKSTKMAISKIIEGKTYIQDNAVINIINQKKMEKRERDFFILNYYKEFSLKQLEDIINSHEDKIPGFLKDKVLERYNILLKYGNLIEDKKRIKFNLGNKYLDYRNKIIVKKQHRKNDVNYYNTMVKHHYSGEKPKDFNEVLERIEIFLDDHGGWMSDRNLEQFLTDPLVQTSDGFYTALGFSKSSTITFGPYHPVEGGRSTYYKTKLTIDELKSMLNFYIDITVKYDLSQSALARVRAYFVKYIDIHFIGKGLIREGSFVHLELEETLVIWPKLVNSSGRDDLKNYSKEIEVKLRDIESEIKAIEGSFN